MVNSKKKIRKHRAIDQNTGKIKKGFKFSGKRTKTGLPIIVRVKKRKPNRKNYYKQWYQENTEHKLHQQKNWYLNNIEERRLYLCDWYKDNKDWKKRYYRQNKDRLQEYYQNWYTENAHLVRTGKLKPQIPCDPKKSKKSKKSNS